MKKKEFTIALAGNPNCGKTALFNGLTGSNQSVGNWPGVTVEIKEGNLSLDRKNITIIDLPGIYSFSAWSDDEKISRDYILSGKPDLIINIIDSTNIERNLYLTTLLLEMKVPVIILLNMIDLAVKKGITIDTDFMEKTLGTTVMPVSVMNRQDIEAIKKTINTIFDDKPVIPDVKITYPNEIEDVVKRWEEKLSDFAIKNYSNPRWFALKILEGDEWVIEKVTSAEILSADEISTGILGITKILKDTPDIQIAEYRYGYITGITKKAITRRIDRKSVSDKIDTVVMNKILGIPVFFFVMYMVFWVSVTFGSVFIDFFDILFGALFVSGFGALLEKAGAGVWLVSILAGGVGTGIQTVSTFIPVIFFMFLMLSILEDSGYMARAAFVMDKFMKVLGLPGKAFVPMIVGFGCTVPAILGTRTLESKKDRFLTIFMCPLMSCGARLPVYALFGAAFFGQMAGRVVFSIYMAGVILAVLTGLVLKRTVFHGSYSQFVMELPSYHAPRLKHIMIHTWIRLKLFIIRAGKVIVMLVLVLSLMNSLNSDFTFGNDDVKDSLLAKIGMTITPVFMPMGVERDNWPAVAGLFSGLFAKESVIGTMSSLYSQLHITDKEQEEENNFSLKEETAAAFLSIFHNLGAIFNADDSEYIPGASVEDNSILSHIRNRFTPHSAYAFLLFVLIYFPCVAALAAAIKEMGSFYGFYLVVYLTVLAWITSTLYYQIAEGHNPVWIAIPAGMLVLLYAAFKITGKYKT